MNGCCGCGMAGSYYPGMSFFLLGSRAFNNQKSYASRRTNHTHKMLIYIHYIMAPCAMLRRNMKCDAFRLRAPADSVDKTKPGARPGGKSGRFAKHNAAHGARRPMRRPMRLNVNGRGRRPSTPASAQIRASNTGKRPCRRRQAAGKPTDVRPRRRRRRSRQDPLSFRLFPPASFACLPSFQARRISRLLIGRTISHSRPAAQPSPYAFCRVLFAERLILRMICRFHRVCAS